MKKRVKVAIIDTGIDIKHEYLRDNIIGGIAFESNGDYIEVTENYIDDNGHGTACAATIKKEFNNIDIFAIKALDRSGKTNIQVLEEALKYLLKTDITLINLSLSISPNYITDELSSICNELAKKNKIIVCSLANGLDKSYPAVLKNVIGVRGSILESRDSIWYNKDYSIQCVVDNSKYLTPYLHNSYILFGRCNSQAAAKLTGKIANIISVSGSSNFDKVQNQLIAISKKSYWTMDDLLENRCDLNVDSIVYDRNNPIVKEIIDLLCENLNINDYEIFYNNNFYDENISIDNNNLFNIVQLIEKKFNLDFNYMDICRDDLLSVYTLANLVENSINKN